MPLMRNRNANTGIIAEKNVYFSRLLNAIYYVLIYFDYFLPSCLHQGTLVPMC